MTTRMGAWACLNIQCTTQLTVSLAQQWPSALGLSQKVEKL